MDNDDHVTTPFSVQIFLHLSFSERNFEGKFWRTVFLFPTHIISIKYLKVTRNPPKQLEFMNYSVCFSLNATTVGIQEFNTLTLKFEVFYN